jgi:hypothetical protein
LQESARTWAEIHLELIAGEQSMFIVWGRRVSRKRIGYVADFCPICRGPQAFLMNSVSAHQHVYFVPVGDTSSGYERTCQGCKITFLGTPKFYKASKKLPPSVQEIVQSSFPSFNEVYGERLRIEDVVRKDPSKLPQNVRAALLRQPFSVVSPLVQARFRQQSKLDMHSVMALVLAIVGALIAAQIADLMHSDYAGTIFLAVGSLGITYFLLALLTEPRRYLKRFITPLLAKALSPLQPTESEIATVLGELKRSKQRLGRHLRTPQLLKAIAVV